MILCIILDGKHTQRFGARICVRVRVERGKDVVYWAPGDGRRGY